MKRPTIALLHVALAVGAVLYAFFPDNVVVQALLTTGLGGVVGHWGSKAFYGYVDYRARRRASKGWK